MGKLTLHTDHFYRNELFDRYIYFQPTYKHSADNGIGFRYGFALVEKSKVDKNHFDPRFFDFSCIRYIRKFLYRYIKRDDRYNINNNKYLQRKEKEK